MDKHSFICKWKFVVSIRHRDVRYSILRMSVCISSAGLTAGYTWGWRTDIHGSTETLLLLSQTTRRHVPQSWCANFTPIYFLSWCYSSPCALMSRYQYEFYCQRQRIIIFNAAACFYLYGHLQAWMHVNFMLLRPCIIVTFAISTNECSQ